MGAGEEVDADPSEHFARSAMSVCGRNDGSEVSTFILRPGILVGPPHETLVDPSEQGYRRIREAIGKCLRRGRLNLEVTLT